MGLFGKSKKEREKEYMNRLDVPLCLKEDFELSIRDYNYYHRYTYKRTKTKWLWI